MSKRAKAVSLTTNPLPNKPPLTNPFANLLQTWPTKLRPPPPPKTSKSNNNKFPSMPTTNSCSNSSKKLKNQPIRPLPTNKYRFQTAKVLTHRERELSRNKQQMRINQARLAWSNKILSKLVDRRCNKNISNKRVHRIPYRDRTQFRLLVIAIITRILFRKVSEIARVWVEAVSRIMHSCRTTWCRVSSNRRTRLVASYQSKRYLALIAEIQVWRRMDI